MIPKNVLKSIQAVVGYLIMAEEKHYEECRSGGSPTRTHIVHHLRRLDKFANDEQPDEVCFNPHELMVIYQFICKHAKFPDMSDGQLRTQMFGRDEAARNEAFGWYHLRLANRKLNTYVTGKG